MTKFIKHNLIIGVFIALTSCATSMTPIEVNKTLPSLTKSKFIPKSQVDEVIKTNKCQYITKGRNYVASIGLTTRGDLKNGAKGIDEWVSIDKGNSFVLIGYKWITIDHNGTTQLHIDFDTLICK